MTLTLDLPPEVKAHLHERASQHGQKPEDYLAKVADEAKAVGERPPGRQAAAREAA